MLVFFHCVLCFFLAGKLLVNDFFHSKMWERLKIGGLYKPLHAKIRLSQKIEGYWIRRYEESRFGIGKSRILEKGTRDVLFYIFFDVHD